MKLSFKPVRTSHAEGVSGALWRLSIGTDVVPHIYIYIYFQMCNRLPEMMKNGNAGIFPVYYSLNEPTLFAYDSITVSYAGVEISIYALLTEKWI